MLSPDGPPRPPPDTVRWQGWRSSGAPGATGWAQDVIAVGATEAAWQGWCALSAQHKQRSLPLLLAATTAPASAQRAQCSQTIPRPRLPLPSRQPRLQRPSRPVPRRNCSGCYGGCRQGGRATGRWRMQCCTLQSKLGVCSQNVQTSSALKTTDTFVQWKIFVCRQDRTHMHHCMHQENDHDADGLQF